MLQKLKLNTWNEKQHCSIMPNEILASFIIFFILLLCPGAIIMDHTFLKHNLSLWRSTGFPKITMLVLWWILSSRGQCSTNSEDTVQKFKKTNPKPQMLTNFILFWWEGQHSKILRIWYNVKTPGCKTESIASYPIILTMCQSIQYP